MKHLVFVISIILSSFILTGFCSGKFNYVIDNFNYFQ